MRAKDNRDDVEGVAQVSRMPWSGSTARHFLQGR
jgi:hypothetical protein